jgi:hypothetical protein
MTTVGLLMAVSSLIYTALVLVVVANDGMDTLHALFLIAGVTGILNGIITILLSRQRP